MRLVQVALRPNGAKGSISLQDSMKGLHVLPFMTIQNQTAYGKILQVEQHESTLLHLASLSNRGAANGAGGIVGAVWGQGQHQPTGQREGPARAALHPQLRGPGGTDPSHAF